jgi:hypothetical protein
MTTVSFMRRVSVADAGTVYRSRLILPAWVTLLACGALVAVAAQAQPIDRLIAVVGDRALLASDLHAAIVLGSVPDEAAPEEVQVEQLVRRELMRLEVDRFGVQEPPREAIDEHGRQVAGMSAGEPWARLMEATGLGESNLRRMIADDLRIAAYLDQRFLTAAQPTELEVGQRAAAAIVRPPTPTELAAARQALVGERRQVLIDEWVAGLRRRSVVRVAARR